MKSPVSKNSRSKDFRYIFANGIGVRFNDNDVTLIFGVKEGDSDEEAVLEEVGVILTPKTAKLLAETLSQVIQNFEQTTGVTLPTNEAFLKSLEESFLASAKER